MLSFFVVAVTVSFAQSAAEKREVYEQLSVFSDPLATQLKKGVKRSALSKIRNEQIREAALEMLRGNYDQTYRYATYEAFLSPRELGEQLTIGDGYSKYENMTGIYLSQGKHVVLVDGIESGRKVGVIVPNWERRAPDPEKPTEDPKGWGIERQYFELQNGANIIEVKDFGGLAYIDYYSKEPQKENPIKVHFLNGAANGYFDSRQHTDADWDKLIDNAVYPILDAKGRYIQIAYPVEALKKYAYGKGINLLNNYDSLVYRQHRILGLEKYNQVPDNRILSRVNYNYYMFRDGDGVAYMGDKKGYAMGMVVDPASVIKGDPCWGFSHEIGHVHQVRPYLNWGGLGEVSNNIFALYGTTSFGNKSRLSEQKNYEKVRESVYGKGISYLQDGDVFNRLVPFWQLQLYFAGPGNNPDFYPDLFEAFRRQAAQAQQGGRGERGNFMARGQNPAIHQLNFMKTACEVSGVDLTEFFEKYGFFYVGEFEFDDYGKYKYAMTKEMADACKQEIAAMKLPKPTVDIAQLQD